MKILYLNPTGDLYGATRCMLHTLDGIDRSSFEPQWILPHRGPLEYALEQRQIPYRIMPDLAVMRKSLLLPMGLVSLMWQLLRSTLRLNQLIRREHFDLLHSNSTLVLTGALAARTANVPHVWHVREIMATYPSLWRWYAPQVLRGAQQVICVSQACANQFSHFGKATPVRVIYDAVDWDRAATNRTRAEARQHFNLPESATVIGSVGYLNPRKGADVLLKAYASVRRSHAGEMRLILAGQPFAGNEDFAQALRQRAVTLGLENEVLFPGYVEEIGTLFAALDLFALPTREPEGFGMAVAEAMSVGLPVIATRIGGILEIVEDGKTGILVTPDSPTELAKELEHLLDNVTLRVQIGNAARQSVRERFPETYAVRQLQDVYLSLRTPIFSTRW